MLETQCKHNLNINMKHILGIYREIKYSMFLRIQMCKKIPVIILEDYGESGDNEIMWRS